MNECQDPRSHCWHPIWSASLHQPMQHNASEQQCCWCGKREPLSTGYAHPQAHGKHAPPPFPQPRTLAVGALGAALGLAAGYTIVREGGIPLPDTE